MTDFWISVIFGTMPFWLGALLLGVSMGKDRRRARAQPRTEPRMPPNLTADDRAWLAKQAELAGRPFRDHNGLTRPKPTMKELFADEGDWR